MANQDVLDIAPGGDVVLTCAPDEKPNIPHRLRVSSTVLTLASPVLKALLGPKFREGDALATNGYVEVPLPEDAAEPMTTILKVMHMDHSIISFIPDVASLVLAASLADKYDCTAAIAHSSYFWLSQASHKPAPAEHTGLLTAAYLFRQDGFFTQIGRKLVMQFEGTITIPEEAKLAGIEEIYVQAERERDRMIKQVLGVVENRLTLKAGDGHRTDDLGCVVNRDCTYGARRAKALIIGLRNARLWPSNQFTTKWKSVQTAVRAVRALDYQWLDKIGPCSASCSGMKFTKASTMVSLLAREIDLVEKSLLLFCLECARAGDMKPKKACEHGVEKQCEDLGE